MTRLQNLLIVTATILLLVIYFGFDIKSSKMQGDLAKLERTGISVDIQPLVAEAKMGLGANDLNEIASLENQLATSEGEGRITALKELSGKYYRLGRYYLAGSYAEMVADDQPTGEAWSIAATTYVAGLSDEDDLIRQASLNKAIESFENAISMEPDVIQYRVNLALVYAESPPPDNPMKGVQMLLSLNEKNPDDVLVLNALARLAIKTGQWDRAQQRLELADSLQPENTTTICLLADVYSQLNDQRAQAVRDKCNLLTLKK